MSTAPVAWFYTIALNKDPDIVRPDSDEASAWFLLRLCEPDGLLSSIPGESFRAESLPTASGELVPDHSRMPFFTSDGWRDSSPEELATRFIPIPGLTRLSLDQMLDQFASGTTPLWVRKLVAPHVSAMLPYESLALDQAKYLGNG